MNKTNALGKLDNILMGRHYSKKTRKTYRFWVRKFCDALRSDSSIAEAKESRERVERFLSSLAKADYSASSQNQAFNALIFFYRNVLGIELEKINALRARKPQRIREAADPVDTKRFLAAVPETSGYPMKLLAHLYYECGLRLSEATQVRLKDIALRKQTILIRNGKGGKDRMVNLPCSLVFPISRQIQKAKAMWEQDHRQDLPVPLPGRLAHKYRKAPFEQGWYWLFPAHKPCEYPAKSSQWFRWHVHESTVSRALRSAANSSGLKGKLSAHVLRHSYATDLLNQGANVRAIQQQMGHKYLDTTMGYLHVSNGFKLWSPMEVNTQ